MHPMLKPAMRRSWRDRDSVQFGTDPARAVVLEAVDRGTAAFLDLLDGTRGLGQVRREAAVLGLGPQRVDRVLGVLREGGVLDDALAAVEPKAMPDAARERLRPDLASLSVVHPAPGAGQARMAARRRASLRVRGGGRVGGSVAAVLAAAGVGRVDVVDTGRAEPWDAAPCGISAADVGRPRAAAARAAARRGAPERRPASRRSAESGDQGGGPDLVLIAPRDGVSALAPDRAESEPLVRAGAPHLYAGVTEGTGFVGPLFAPGGPACGECLALHRADRDPAWPRILAQLRSGRPGPVPACDIALATAVAGLAAMHALMFLDGGVPASLGGRVLISLADSSVRVQPVRPHPRCPCRGGSSTAVFPSTVVPSTGAHRNGEAPPEPAGQGRQWRREKQLASDVPERGAHV